MNQQSVQQIDTNIADKQSQAQSPLLLKLEKLNKVVTEKKRLKDTRAKQSTRKTKAIKTKVTSVTRKNRGRASNSIIEDAQLKLFELEQQGKFQKYNLRPESEFPTFLTRLPLFSPCKRNNQKKILDEDNALPFSTSWGEGKKHGPPLTVYDEDTLIAIGRLRQNLLIGRPHNMPVPVSELFKANDEENVRVHVVQCMITDIQNVCGTSRGGKNNKMRLESIKRLGATVIEFTRKGKNGKVGKGAPIKLIDVAWQEYEDNAILFIQFTPVMAAWYEKEYTYIDWNLRRKLTYTGKAVHRFLASQPKNYEIGTKKLMQTVGYIRGHNKFLADLRDCLDQLIHEGWVNKYKVEGTGRRIPYKLVLNRH